MSFPRWFPTKTHARLAELVYDLGRGARDFADHPDAELAADMVAACRHLREQLHNDAPYEELLDEAAWLILAHRQLYPGEPNFSKALADAVRDLSGLAWAASLNYTPEATR